MTTAVCQVQVLPAVRDRACVSLARGRRRSEESSALPQLRLDSLEQPTPVLAAVIELPDRDGQVLLARNAAWPGGSSDSSPDS